MKNALVIGGTGFIGSHLIEKLYQKGYKVKALARSSSNTSLLESWDIELCLGDILSLESLKEACLGQDIVFCLINIKPDNLSQKDYKDKIYKIHIEGTNNLIEACKGNNIKRIIYFSSVAAIGYKEGIKFYYEFTQENPKDAYGKAKLEAEKILRASQEKNEIDVTILRPPGVFGERDLGALGKITSFVNKRIVPVMGNGSNRLNLTYVGNVVNQAILLAENSDSIGKTYITADQRPYSVNELINNVARALDIKVFKIHIPIWFIMFSMSVINFFSKIILKKKIINSESIKAIISERIFVSSRIFRELSYKQEYNLEIGVKRTIEWYKKENVH
jgi:nucleoside-diphosphate-sugar epimerase